MNTHIMNTGRRPAGSSKLSGTDCNEFTPVLVWLASHRTPRWVGPGCLAAVAALTLAVLWAGAVHTIPGGTGAGPASTGTLRNYLSRAIGKTGSRNRTEALTLARDKGWL